ncbi:MAG: hypothetical protein M1275_03200 [Patescibacteria group bacterium]|nr:hypothetical protein [Patescibacteria group bacterium]
MPITVGPAQSKDTVVVQGAPTGAQPSLSVVGAPPTSLPVVKASPGSVQTAASPNLQGGSPDTGTTISQAVGISGFQGGTPIGGLALQGSSPTLQGGSMQDLSGTYANVGGTIYNKLTNTSYHSQEEFAAALGVPVGSLNWKNYKFDQSWQPPFDANKAQAQYHAAISKLPTEQLTDSGAVRAAAAASEQPAAPEQANLVPGNATPDQTTQINSLLQNLTSLATKMFDPAQTGTYLVDTYNKLAESAGLNKINTDLVNMEAIINGTPDDIRAELKNAGALVTESDVRYLAGERNKELLKQYDRLQGLKTNAENYINTIVDLTGKDRTAVQAQLESAFKMTSTIADLEQKLQQTQVTQYAAARDFAVANAVKKPFYNIGGTVYSTASGLPAHNIQEYIAMGGKGDFSDVQAITAVGQLQSIQFTDSAGNVVKGYWNPATGQIINPSALAGVTGGISGAGVVSTPSGSYDLSRYNPSNPNYPSQIANIAKTIGVIDTADQAQTYIDSVATGSPITGDMVMEASARTGTDPAAILALLQSESSFGMAGAATSNYNPGNIKFIGQEGATQGTQSAESGYWANWGSWQNGVNAVGKWLANHEASAAAGALGTTGSSDVNLTASGYTTKTIGNTGMTQAAIDGAAQIYNAKGTMPSLGLGANANVRAAREAVLNRAAELRAGKSTTDTQLEFQAMQKFITNSNSTQQIRMRQAEKSVEGSLGELQKRVEKLNQDGAITGFQFVNKKSVAAAANGAFGTKVAADAQAVLGQISLITDELGQTFMGGNSPTDAAFDLAKGVLSADFSKEQFDTQIGLIQKNLQIRKGSWTQSGMITPSGFQETGTTAPSGGTIAGYLGTIGLGNGNSAADQFLDSIVTSF